MKAVSRTERGKLALTGFLQVVFVAMNTVFITQKAWIPLIVTSWAISYIWSGNVKKVAFGDTIDRYVYATGAALGCGFGVIAANTALTILRS